MINKKCTKCHKRLSIDNFVKDSSKIDGYYPSCKKCYRERIGSKERPEWFGNIKIINNIKCRWCSGCEKYIDYDFFYTRKNGKSDTKCKDCVLKYRTSEKSREKDKKRREKARYECISNYSKGKMCCNCCGENEIKFLSIDHIDGGGNIHRKNNKINKIAEWLRKNNYPNGYQVLCYNCNLSKGFYGICPHKLKKI